MRRSEVFGIVSDQATEKGIADVCHMMHFLPGEFTKPEDSLRAFPNAMWMPEHLHIFNNALENAVTSAPLWSQFLPKLRAIERFLQDASLRTLFRATCLHGQPVVSKLFANFSGSHIEWRWEYLEKTLDKLVPLLPYLRDSFKVDSLLNSVEGNINPAIVKEARAALDTPLFAEFSELVRTVGKCIYKFTHMLEGCPCHSDIWSGPGTYKSKVARMVQLTGHKSCFWKGRMGPWLQVVGIQHLTNMITTSTSDQLQSSVSAMTERKRGIFLSLESVIKAALIEELTQKLVFHSEPPYNCISMAWGEFPGAIQQLPGRSARRTSLTTTRSFPQVWATKCIAWRIGCIRGLGSVGFSWGYGSRRNTVD